MKSLLSIAVALASTIDATFADETVKLTDENFSSAMADIYFQEVIDRGGVNKFAHLRQVSSVETQNIIRENRDTLYSWGVFDVKKGIEITLPPAGPLYMSALVIDNDTYIVREEDFEKTGDIGTYQAYPDKTRVIRISHKEAVTDFVYILIRTQTDTTPEGDKKANELQDSIQVKTGSSDVWKSRKWNETKLREKQASYVPHLAEIVAQGTAKGYNERGKTEQFHHNFYSAIGWGGQLERYASYGTTPDIDDFGEDGAIVTIQPPNVDYERGGFWSYQVYGLDGYIHSNNSTLNNHNTTPNPDGTITLRFGSREVFGTDENRADKPDEGFSITSRFYNRKAPIPAELLNPPLQRFVKKGQRESFKGYRAFPEDPARMQEIIDERDLHGATQAYLWSMTIATMLAWDEANLKVGDYHDLVTYVTPFEKRDIITSNATTPYAVAMADLSKTDGMVEITVPAGPVGGLVNDGQMRSVVDLGLAGPDKGKGGKYLILGPGVEEPANHDADHVARSKSNLLFTGFRVLGGDDAQRDALFRAYKLNAVGKPSTTKLVSIGKTPYRGCNLRGIDHWKELHTHMQREHFGPEDAMALQFLKRLGIEKGKPFAPDERQLRILAEAEKKGFEMSVALSAAREKDFLLSKSVFYEGGTWSNPLSVEDIYDHIDSSGALELDSRTSYGHEAITMSEGMTAETVGVGSKYLAAYRDADGQYLNSANDYVLIVPPNPPAEQFWSVTGYNAKTRAMVYTDRKDLSSRHDIHVHPDGSVPVYLSSNPDEMPHPQNCIDIKGQGDIFVYFRTYAPTKAYFSKEWKLPDIQRINK